MEDLSNHLDKVQNLDLSLSTTVWRLSMEEEGMKSKNPSRCNDERQESKSYKNKARIKA